MFLPVFWWLQHSHWSSLSFGLHLSPVMRDLVQSNLFKVIWGHVRCARANETGWFYIHSSSSASTQRWNTQTRLCLECVRCLLSVSFRWYSTEGVLVCLVSRQERSSQLSPLGTQTSSRWPTSASLWGRSGTGGTFCSTDSVTHFITQSTGVSQQRWHDGGGAKLSGEIRTIRGKKKTGCD